MKIFKFEVEFEGVMGKYREIVHQRANHLQGAIRQLYQNESKLVRVVRILEG